jgi:hypothetical protein
LGEKWPVNLACDSDFHVNRRVLLYTAKLRNGIDGFTSLPKEGMLLIFSPEKSEGFSRVPEASMLTTRPLKPLLLTLSRVPQKYGQLNSFMWFLGTSWQMSSTQPSQFFS